MTRILAGIVTFFLAVPVFADPPESLRDFVKRTQSRHAVALYIRNTKVGWMITETKLAQRGGREVAIETMEMVVKMIADGERTEMSERGETVYSLEGNGDIISAEERSTQDKQETVHRVVRSKNGVKITTTVGDRVTSREVALPKENLAEARSLERWFKSKPAKDARFEHYGSTWEDEDINTKEVFSYQGMKTVLWGGVQTDVYLLKINSRGAMFDAELLANGDMIRGKIGELFDLRAEPEELAKKLGEANIDLMAASAIKVDLELGNAKKVEALTLEAFGLKDFKLPQSHRQTVRQENGKTILELKRDFAIDRPARLSEADIKKYTSATPTVQSDQEPIKQLAAKLVGSETDPLKKAELIKNWVYRTLRKTMACNATTALAVLDNKAGDCTEHTLIFVALARAAGLPAREITGVAYVSPIFGWHAWAEIHDGKQWVSVDPTWNELYVDATHITFAHDSQDHAWLNVLGNLRFKALSLTTGE